jgi:hypothetical protein
MATAMATIAIKRKKPEPDERVVNRENPEAQERAERRKKPWASRASRITEKPVNEERAVVKSAFANRSIEKAIIPIQKTAKIQEE